MAYRAVKSRVNAFGALSEDTPKKTKAPAKAPEPFIPVMKTTANWADSSDEEDEVVATYIPPENDVEPEEEEEESEEESQEESEEEQVAVEVKPEKKQKQVQLSKKDQKRKEMEDLDSILAELAVEQPVASQPTQTEQNEKKQIKDNNKAAEIEISNEDLSSLGILNNATSGKKKRKKKRKKKNKESTAASTVKDTDSSTAPPVPPTVKLSKADVKAKLLAKKKGKGKKKSISNASAAAKKEAARRKAGKKKKKDKTKFNQQPNRR